MNVDHLPPWVRYYVRTLRPLPSWRFRTGRRRR